MKDSTFKTILFYAFLLIFLATAVLILLSLAGYLPGLDAAYKKALFTMLIVEVIAGIFGFWKSLTAFSDPPDVSGEWDYECTREGGERRHGGTCRIDVKKGPLGWEFTISGKRTWLARKVDGQWKPEELGVQFFWENTWGTFTGSDALRYAYSINVGGSLVQGYGWASIKRNGDKKPMVLEGNFYQLPPHDPFYGEQRYTRRSS